MFIRHPLKPLFSNGSRALKRSLFLLSFLLPLVSVAQTPTPAAWNEIYDEKGDVRPQYEGVWGIAQSFSDKKKEKITSKTIKQFEGDNPLLYVPRVYTEAEFQTISNGVSQRARALQAFVSDHYSGRRSYLSEGVIPGPLVDRIIGRNYETHAGLVLDGTPLEFWYGPDIIRDSEGNFRVIEDNTGFVGGMGDLIASRKFLLKNVPEYGPFIAPGHDPKDFYKQLAEDYKGRAKEFGGIPLLIRYSDEISPDNEDKRVQKIFADNGIDGIIYDPSEPQNVKKKITVKKDGLYWGKKKVGYLICNIEAADLDPKNKASKERFKKAGGWRIKKPLKSEFGIEGFWDLVKSKKVGITNPIGLEFINDKEFYIYVEDLIRFYLHEEPILKNIKTQSFAIYKKGESKGTLNSELLESTFKNPDPNVFKGVNGRGGDEVSLGRKMKAKDFRILKPKILADPEHFIVQDFTGISYLDGYLVDSRPLAAVFQDHVLVSNTHWGRASPMGGSGKVNIAEGGSVTTSFVANGEAARAKRVPSQPAQIVIFRHGEKNENNGHLNARGYRRADALVDWIDQNPIVSQYGAPVAIYASYKDGSAERAVETVAPAARHNGLRVIEKFRKIETDELVDEIMHTPAYNGKTVIVSWQHTKILDMIDAFGVKDSPSDWPDDVYDRAYVIRWNQNGKPRLAKLNEGILPGDKPASITTEGKFPCGKRMAGEE